MAEIRPLSNLADWESLRVHPGPVMVFKHSTACPISARANQEFEAWAATLPGESPKLARVRVIEERPVSQQIAADTRVTHESPQALLLHQGRVLWHASHYAITRSSLAAAVAAVGL
jgi:bacillithiol system protein YtxJ